LQSFVLPIVSALNGEPQVIEEGEIIYTFPDLQVSTSSGSSSMFPWSNNKPQIVSTDAMILQRAGLSARASNRDIQTLLEYNRIPSRGVLERSELIALLEQALPPPTPQEQAAMIESDPSVLQEQELQFSIAPDMNKALAAGLGVVNLGGALYLGNLFSQAALYSVRLPGIYGAVQAFYPLLLGYALLFNMIPIGRKFYIDRENDKIRQRNSRRQQWKAALQTATSNTRTRIGAKIQAARRYGRRMKQLGRSPQDVIYDTQQEIELLEATRELDALKQFDQLLDASEQERDSNTSPFQ
jgi:hypothetical protein